MDYLLERRRRQSHGTLQGGGKKIWSRWIRRYGKPIDFSIRKIKITTTRKERMLWLAGTVYFSFSIVIVGWILLPGHTITDVQKGWFTGFVSALGLAVFFFAYIQNWWKCQAAHVDVLMTDWLSQKANSKSSLKDVCEVKKYPHTTFREMVCYSFRYGSGNSDSVRASDLRRCTDFFSLDKVR